LRAGLDFRAAPLGTAKTKGYPEKVLESAPQDPEKMSGKSTNWADSGTPLRDHW